MPTETKSTLPLDYDQWLTEWRAWKTAHAESMTPTRSPFQGKNFLAEEVVGVWKVNGRTVELSSVTFPNFEDRDPETGRLLEGYKRRIGVTFEDATDVVDNFEQLEKVLGL